MARRPDAFEDENDVESFNADNDEEEDGDNGYHDDDYHIMVKRNGWGIIVWAKRPQETFDIVSSNCLPTCTKYHKKM